MSSKRKSPPKAPTQTVESVKAESNATVTPKPKRANSTAKKLPTESVAKPTVQSLQKQVENLGQQLSYANKEVVRLKEDNDELADNYNYEYNRSLWSIVKERIAEKVFLWTLPFRTY